jgi:hypothetical protein
MAGLVPAIDAVRRIERLQAGASAKIFMTEPLAKRLTMQYSKAVVFIAVVVFTSAELN